MQKIMLPLTTLLLALIHLPVLADGTIYKCEKPEGGMRYQKSPCDDDKQTKTTWEENSPEKQTMSIRQGNGGHYFLPGSVGSIDFTFVVDTGATMVALPRAIAKKANLRCESSALTGTANGVTEGCYVTLPKLKFGVFQLSNVQAVILPDLGQPLLGMNALQKFNMIQEHGEMRISDW